MVDREDDPGDRRVGKRLKGSRPRERGVRERGIAVSRGGRLRRHWLPGRW